MGDAHKQNNMYIIRVSNKKINEWLGMQISHVLGSLMNLEYQYYEPVREKTNNLHGRKQRRRSASR